MSIERMTHEYEKKLLRTELAKLYTIRSEQQAEIERLREDIQRVRIAWDAAEQEIERLREQLREQSKSFCTHCGKLFPKGAKGLVEFREHIAKCNQHPLNHMAQQLAECRRLLRFVIDHGIRTEDGTKTFVWQHEWDEFLVGAENVKGDCVD